MSYLLQMTIISAMIHVITSIKCLSGGTNGTEEDCEAIAVEMSCFESATSDMLKTLREETKVSLKEPRWNTGYQCFELQVKQGSPYWKSCTYDNLDLCAELENAKYCRTCKEDLCNSLKYKSDGDKVDISGFVVWICVVYLSCQNILQQSITM